MTREHLSKQVESGINFVATEWVVPDVRDGKLSDQAFTFTVLRDPFERYLSNYYFDLSRGYSKAPNLWSYRDKRAFRQYDYYSRFFATRPNDDHNTLTTADLERARQVLKGLDAVLILESEKTYQQLRPLGVDIGVLGRKKVGAGNKPYPKAFRKQFREEAAWDYELYELGMQLASDRL